MEANVKDLIKIQQEVNKKVKEKLIDYPEGDDFLLAFNVELFEYINAIGTWKWWKHSHELKKERVLDELADCFAFFLSVVDNEQKIIDESDSDEDFIGKIESEINEILSILEGHQQKSSQENYEIVNDLAKYIGTDNEIEPIPTVERFAIAIFMAVLLFEDITWEEITQAYKDKSDVNIKRQTENY